MKKENKVIKTVYIVNKNLTREPFPFEVTRETKNYYFNEIGCSTRINKDGCQYTYVCETLELANEMMTYLIKRQISLAESSVTYYKRFLLDFENSIK